MEDLLISNGGRYIATSESIVDTNTGLRTDINNPNPLFVCEMFKNEFSFSYKYSLIESKDLFGKMRKLIYHLLESDSKMIMEYEVKFGQNMIFESKKSIFTEHRIEESWDYIKNLLIKQNPILAEGWFSDAVSSVKNVASSAWNKTKEIAGDVWDKVKQAGAWVISKGLPWVMKKIEDFMMSPVGIGLDVALTALGIGKLATGIIWGILLIWKVYQLIDGQIPADSVWSYIDIAVCLAGVVFSGAAKGLKTAFKAVGGNVAKVGGKFLEPIISVLSKGLGGIMNLLIKPLEWIAKIFGPKASAMISTFKGKIGTILEKMKTIFGPAATKAGVAGSEGLGTVIKKGLKQDFVKPFKDITSKSLRKSATKGLAVGGGMVLATKGIEKGVGMYAEKQKSKSEEAMKSLASAVPDDTIKQGIEGDMSDLLNQMK
jgi:hypothetical protein